MIVIALTLITIILWVLFWQANLIFAQILGAPTVYSSDQAIEDALKLAQVKPGETVLDLGCGNARSLIIAAKKFSAKGIGIERSLYCIVVARLKVLLAGESKNIQIIFGDLKKSARYIQKADVIYLYLLNVVLNSIERDFFETIRPKTRIVSLAFSFPHKEAKKSVKTKTLGRETKVYLY